MKNQYEIRGEVTAVFIRLKGKTFETIIDTDDLSLLLTSEYSWYASYSKYTNSYYVNGFGIKKRGKQERVRLHRFLMGSSKGRVVDHKNHNTLDNRRSVNLRVVSVSQNLQNRKGLTSHNTSGFRGVSFEKSTRKYRAYIRINNKLMNLGRFETALEAAKVASIARKKSMPYSNEVSQVGG